MVGAPSPCPTSTSRLAALVLLVLAAHSPAQQEKAAKDPRPRIVQQALADLADPVRAPDAQQRLVHLGDYVVEPLRAWLRRDRDQVLAPQRQRIVFVLGRLGRTALPALPELRDALRGDDFALTIEAAWALGRVLPFASADVQAIVRTDLRSIGAELLRDARFEVTYFQTFLGPSPAQDALAASLGYDGSYATAICRWIRAHADAVEDPLLVSQLLRTRLEERMQREPVLWQGHRPGHFGTADVAEAWLELSRAPLDGTAARALLDHWDAEERLRAVWWLREHGAALPFRERADLAGRLWDADVRVATAASEALAAWGTAGLVALVPLRTQQRTHADARVAAACGAAAADVLGSCEALPAGDRDLVQTLDAALQDGPLRVASAKASPAAQAIAAEVLFLAQWQPAAPGQRLLDAVDAAAGSSDDAIRSVFGWLLHDDAAIVNAAFAWLARRGGAVNGAVDTNLTWLARSWVVAEARPCATEAMAWLTTTAASLDELRAMCDDANVRFAARALAALLQRPAGTELPAVERLQALASLPASQVILRSHAQDAGIALGTDVAPPVRVLAAIALADAGVAVPDRNDLAPLVQERCGTPLASLKEHVAALRQRNELTALLDRLEAEMRAGMGIDPQLRWPSAVAAR